MAEAAMTDDLEDLKKHIGNKHSSEDVVTASQVGRLAGALMVDHPAPNKGDAVPPGYHGVFFPGLAPLSNMRSDGQPKSGGPAPAAPLPRRRIIGVRADFLDPMRVGDDITRDTEVTDVVIKDYGAGPTVVITIRDTISTPRSVSTIEERDFLSYTEDGPGEMWPAPVMPADPSWSKTYESSPVMIFRLSASRYNSHRIHYDRDYATKVEGFAGLVVPVTLVTYLMMELVRAEAPGRPLTYFGYRSEKPVIDLGPFSAFGKLDGDFAEMWATDYEGDLAVTAEARF
jgi:3-methylfumaryl-CoA hydratase